MSRRRYSMKAPNRTETSPMAIISVPGAKHGGIAGEQNDLAAEQRVERDVEQKPRQHGRDRRRSLGMSIGQPGVKREEPDLGAVAEQEKDEGEIEHGRLERSGMRHKFGPFHRGQPRADGHLRRHIEKESAPNRASEQMPTLARMKYFHAASIAAWVR